MSTHLDSHLTALPPPPSAGADHAPGRARRHLATPVAALAGTVAVIALAILSALTLLAVTPAGIAVPTTLLLIGGLIAGSLAIRPRLALARRPSRPRI